MSQTQQRDAYLDPRVAAGYDAELERPGGPRDDIEFYVRLARECAATGQSILELGCGTGRVTLPMADAGAAVLGLDRSPAMLAVARAKAAGRPNPRWLQNDMADFALAERFGLIVIPFRSFLHLLTATEQRGCLACAQAHLVEGGRLALNFFNPAPLLAALSGIGLPARPVIGRPGRGLRLRYVGRDEMEGLLTDAGFAVEALYGGFAGEPWAPDSAELVWLARRI